MDAIDIDTGASVYAPLAMRLKPGAAHPASTPLPLASYARDLALGRGQGRDLDLAHREGHGRPRPGAAPVVQRMAPCLLPEADQVCKL